MLALGAFFATVSINTIISEQQQQLQPEIQNQAELEALTQSLASIGIVIGAIILAVGIGTRVIPVRNSNYLIHFLLIKHLWRYFSHLGDNKRNLPPTTSG